MTTSTTPTDATHAGHAGHGRPVTEAFHVSFPCVACAEAVERALRATPHVTNVHVDYPGKTVHVSYHAGMVDAATLQQIMSSNAYGCQCRADDGQTPPVGGGLAALAHQADMTAVTMSTRADRMQYEFPSTAAARAHYGGHTGHTPTTVAAPLAGDARHAPPASPHAGHPGAAASADHGARSAQGRHGSMGHDMSDPTMAKAMEADMRRRFFVALALTIPTILFSPLAMNTFGIELVRTSWANWLMLLFSTPVVFWAGWVFIGGAATSLRYRQLNMSVLIATGVLAAWGFSLLITLLGQGETFYEAAAMLVTFVLFGHWMEMKSRRGTTDALRALFDLVPPTATVIRDRVEREVPTSELVVGDRVRLRPGDKVPVTGCWSRARPASTSRWSRANRRRWIKVQATASSVAPSIVRVRS